MKDLDFDELDKAVSSLMEKAPKDTPPPAKDTEKVVTLPDTAAPEPATPASQPAAPSPEKKEAAPAASAPVAVKRSGRFMDVVHPSSDMRTPSRPASRTGTTLQPMNDIDTSVPAEPAAPALPMPDSLPTPGEEAAPTPAAPTPEPAPPETPAANSWPDPIDVHESAAAQPPAPEPATDTSAQDEQPGSTGSPFLPDAKVEKRPLGGSASPVSADLTDSVTADTMPEEAKKDDTSSAKPTEPMPAELGSDVLAIEAGKDNPGGTPDEEKKENVPQLEGGKTEPAPPPAGPTSIAQQYKVQESSGDPSHAPLYDTAADSHALTHPAKKKSGWLVVVAIIVLVLLGAGAGAFVYFSGLL